MNRATTPPHLGRFIYRYEGGPTFDVLCATATDFHWRCVEGEQPGTEGRETIKRIEIRPGVHFLSWRESSGLVVTQVVDFDAGRVHTVLIEAGSLIPLKGSIEKVE
jgi:phenolic acid decarboxylase